MPNNSVFPSQFSKLQISRLTEAGFNSLYDLVTYFPFRLQNLIPFTSQHKQSNEGSFQYLFTAEIIHIEFRKVGAGYFLVSLLGGNGQRAEAYLFQNHNYIWSELKVGLTFQWILQISAKNFLNILKWSSFKGYQDNKFFVLGQAKMQNWLAPVYSKKATLTSSKIYLLHQKLNNHDYILNLEGLVPSNQFFPSQLDLSQIHKPESIEAYRKAKTDWITFKLFLKMATYKQIKLSSDVLIAKKANIKLKNVKLINNSIPFALTASQKTTIWDILNRIGQIS